jgi:hypothetical protein
MAVDRVGKRLGPNGSFEIMSSAKANAAFGPTASVVPDV